MKRRSFLTNLSAGVVGTGLAMSSVANAAREETKPTFVFVHGALQGMVLGMINGAAGAVLGPKLLRW